MLEQIIFQGLCNIFIVGFFTLVILVMVKSWVDSPRSQGEGRLRNAIVREVKSRVKKAEKELDQAQSNWTKH